MKDKIIKSDVNEVLDAIFAYSKGTENFTIEWSKKHKEILESVFAEMKYLTPSEIIKQHDNNKTRRIFDGSLILTNGSTLMFKKVSIDDPITGFNKPILFFSYDENN